MTTRLATNDATVDGSPRRRAQPPHYILDDPLLTAREAAAERRQGLSTFWRDVRAGLVPAAYYVGPKTPRWRRSELRAALLATRAKQAP